MFFLLNTRTNEVVGYYDQRDLIKVLKSSDDYAQISSIKASEIMREQIWNISPEFYADMWGTAEDVYCWYIRRNNNFKI